MDDGVRLVVVAESLSPSSPALLERADLEGTINVQKLVTEEGIDVTAALRDVIFQKQRRKTMRFGTGA